jgi:crotonobetainyl-CoA:carnitine CoA-transferase CaiB-like acyl-CoA transferase
MKLRGIRVLDLSQFLPGPHVAMMMADHGAEVIKVEAPGGDPGRNIGLAQAGHTSFFRNTNRGKKSIVLDLKRPEAREAFLKLAATADVVIEAFRPGVVNRLRVAYRDLAQINPKIIYCSISAFGQHGPDSGIPAHDLAVQARAGVLSVSLDANNDPVMPTIASADMAASLTAFAGILLALFARERSGQGDYLDIAMLDSLVALLPNVLGPVFVEKRAPVPEQERTWGGSAFYRIYRTKDDRHIVLGGQEMKFVRTLLEELNRADLIALAGQGPGVHQQPLISYLNEVFRGRTRSEWIEWFRHLDVCFAPVSDLREAFDDPLLTERAMLLTDTEGVEHLGAPIKFAAESPVPCTSVPHIGEHTLEVLQSVGYSKVQLTELAASGAIGVACERSTA